MEEPRKKLKGTEEYQKAQMEIIEMENESIVTSGNCTPDNVCVDNSVCPAYGGCPTYKPHF